MIGYVKLVSGGFGLDPDEQVQSVVRLIFEEFDRHGSVPAVLKFLQQHDIKMPIRSRVGINKGEIEWRIASPAVVNRVLRHELYADMYRMVIARRIRGARKGDIRIRGESL